MIYVVRYVLSISYTLFWGALACLAALVDRSGEAGVWIARRWARSILWSCGVQVEAEGLENVDPQRAHVFMSNHQSVFDVLALVATLPVSFRFVAKRELTWIPIFGWGIYLSGHVVVDRGHRARAVHSLKRAAERIRGGVSVIIFPEGTRSPSGALREFKSGGFHLALQAGVPILPVSVSGSQLVIPKRSLRIESGRITVRYGKPIETQGLEVGDRGALKREVRTAIRRGMDAALQRSLRPQR